MDVRDMLATLLVLLLGCATVVKGTASSERASNYVEVIVYQLSLSGWDDGADDNFASAVTQQANSYCASNYDQCGLNSGWEATHSFGSNDVEILDGYPTYLKPYLTIQYALAFPTGIDISNDSSTEYYVPRNALRQITINSIDSFDNYTDHHIVQVDDEEFSIPPDDTLNIILCIVGVLLLVVALGTCLVMKSKCGGPPEAVDKEEEANEGKPMAVEMKSVETVKTAQPTDSLNGAKTESVAVET